MKTMTCGQLGGQWREQIPAMERRRGTTEADPFRERRIHAPEGRGLVPQRFCQQPVVRREEHGIPGLRGKDRPRRSDARIHDGQVHRTRWKITPGATQPEPGNGHRVSGNAMGQIYQRGARQPGQDAALHDPDVRLLEPEVRGQADDAARPERPGRHHTATRRVGTTATS